MPLKLIPREDPIINFHVKPLGKRPKASFQSKVAILKNRLDGLKKHDDHVVLQKLTVRLFDFVSKATTYSSEEIAGLIHNIQHGLLCLQRKQKDCIMKKLEAERKNDRKKIKNKNCNNQ